MSAPEPINVADYERLAAERLDPGVHGYFAGGAGDERTLRENVAAFGRWTLHPRVLVDVGGVSTATTVLGDRDLDAAAGRPGRLPAPRRPRRRGGDGARGRGRRDDHVPVDDRDLAPGGDRGRGPAGAALVPALLLQRPGRHPGADRRGGRLGLRRDRADRRRPAGRAARARPAHRLRGPAGASPRPAVAAAVGSDRADHGRGGLRARRPDARPGTTSPRSPRTARCRSCSRGSRPAPTRAWRSITAPPG